MRLIRRLAGLGLSLATAFTSHIASAGQEGDPVAGESLYRTGIGANGAPVKAVTKGDVEIDGSQLTCISCHRASGMGTSEGGIYVSPITAGILFSAREANEALRNERFREYYKDPQADIYKTHVSKGRLRRAYDDASLAAAIRDGLDPEGRRLDDIMPRYAVSERDAANLAAFLKTLSPEPSEGVGARVNFATIIAGDIDPATADAHEKLMTVFADWINRDIRTDMARPGFSTYYRSEFKESYREWDMHVWKLEGDSSTWRAQLDAHYEAQPVFAVLGPLVEGDYAPVAAFCDEKETPCILPTTELPSLADGAGGYSLYFSRGLYLEADALALWLSQQDQKPTLIHHISLGGPLAEEPAARFRHAASKRLAGVPLMDHQADSEAALSDIAAAAKPDEALVIWSGNQSDLAVKALNAAKPKSRLITLPSKTRAAIVERLAPELRDRIRISWPYDKPTAYHADGLRVRAWVRSRKLPITEWRYQLQAYFAMKVTEFAMNHVLTDYYKDYLIEIIEHDLGAGFDPGPHPRLSLGPDQRFASKGAYVMRLNAEMRDGIEPVSAWLIPQ